MSQPSKAYLHGHHDSVLRSHRWRTAENSAAYLLPWLTPAAHLLDVRRRPGTIHVDLGDVRQLGFDDASFDIVHAHQVLQHLADPVSALAEMRRVCRPGGVVAARDGDYGGFLWFP